MANCEAWCADKLSKLVNEDLRISTLTEIKNHFSEISQDEANQTAKVLQLPMVFDCLNDSKTEQIDLACEVLSICMSSLSLGASTNRYASSLERALYHPSTNVKIMALREILRTAENADSISELNRQGSIIVALVVCLGDASLSVAKKAADILVLVGRTPQGLQNLLATQIKQVFSETIAISGVVRFRVYELITQIAVYSEESLELLVSSGLIYSLISEIDNDDILLKLNALELLSQLGLSDHGLVFLESQGVIQKVTNNLGAINEDPLGLIVLPGLLRFFGNVAHWKPYETFHQYPAAFNSLLDIIISGEFAVLGVAYDTLGHIAATSNGKFTLQLINDKFIAAIKEIGEQLISIPTVLRVRALHCFENLIRVPLEEQNNRICSLVQTWFGSLYDDTMCAVIKYAQNPFIEIRCAGLSILEAMAEQTWGQEYIRNSPGLVEFLLDRRIESTKESKELKYAVVKALSTSDVFSENLLSQLRQYVKEGPFYVQAITEVAIEGST